MQDLEHRVDDLVSALRDDGQADLAARVEACQVARATRYSTGIGWGICRTVACPACRRWIARRWCRRAVGQLAHAAAGAVADVRIEVGEVPITGVHDAVRRWRAGLRNVRARRSATAGGRRWAEIEAVGAVEIEGEGGPWRRVRARAVVHHPGTDWQAVRDAVGGQWAGATVTPAADVGDVLTGAVAWVGGCRDVAVWGALHATGRGLRPLACVMRPIGHLAARAEVAQHQDADPDDDHYAFVL